MTNISALFKALSTLYEQEQAPDLITPVGYTFPFKEAYTGQDKVIKDLAGFQQSALSSPTGTGKTAVIMSLTRGVPSIIIEPRKYLQKQCQSYFNDFVLFGRSEYPCFHAKNAAIAPCNRKIPCSGVNVPEACTSAKERCDACVSDVFSTKSGFIKYPCHGCEYIKAQMGAKQTLRNKGVVICNFGNFWPLLKMAEVVVIDEADLFFREISHATKLMYTSAKTIGSIHEMLTAEVKGLQVALDKASGATAYSIQNMLYNAKFLLEHNELCFSYQKKDKIYVEINPVNVSVLKDKIFQGKRLLIVSATLGEFDIPRHDYRIWQRRGVYFCPVAKMTSANFKRNPWIMAAAADRIETISSVAEGLFDTRKFPIHCANLSSHAFALNNLLGPDRKHLLCKICGEKVDDVTPDEQEVKCPKCGRKWIALEDKCTMHTSGNLMETIDDFTNNDKRYLLVAGADYGADLIFSKVQFILKFPYANLDERMRVLERTMGKQDFNKFYVGEAINRLVQASGRVCRGFADFGVTIILDSKAVEVYQTYPTKFPPWFRDSVDKRIY